METKDVEQLTIQTFEKLAELEKAIESSPAPRFSGSDRRIVDTEEMYDILGDIKVTIPKDIRRANSILVDAENITSNAENYATELVDNATTRSETILQEASAKYDEIIAKAKQEAEDIISEANKQRERLISNNEVTAEATRRAELLERKAEYNAKLVYDNAKAYADDVLGSLMRFLEEYYSMVEVNRKDLGVIPKPDFSKTPEEAEEEMTVLEDVDEPEEERDEGLFGLGIFKRKKKKAEAEAEPKPEPAEEDRQEEAPEEE